MMKKIRKSERMREGGEKSCALYCSLLKYGMSDGVRMTRSDSSDRSIRIDIYREISRSRKIDNEAIFRLGD